MKRKTLLTEFEEQELHAWIKHRTAMIKTPLSTQIRSKALDILACRGPTIDAAGEKWLKGFQARQGVISRAARTREQARAGLKEESAVSWFMQLEKEENGRETDVVCFHFSPLFFMSAASI